jgi:hypothetical protein
VNIATLPVLMDQTNPVEQKDIGCEPVGAKCNGEMCAHNTIC